MAFLEDGIVLLTFLAALGATLAWIYRRVISPTHAKVERILKLVDYELKPNGGGSLVDQVTWIKTNHKEVAEQAVGIARRLDDYQRAMNHRLEKIEAAVLGRDLARDEAAGAPPRQNGG